MTVNDLPVGALFALGAVDKGGVETDCIWIKASQDNVMLSDGFVSKLEFDSCEPDNASRDRRERGSNFFPQSNLFQWLNASGCDWFCPSHASDAAPSYAGRNGFLTKFAPWEVDALVPFDFATEVPDGFRREFGAVHTTNARVSIPSYSEVCRLPEGDPHTREGAFLPCVNHARFLSPMWLRTPSASTVLVANSDRSIASRAACSRYYVRPRVVIDGAVSVYDTPDENGVYYPIPPDGYESCISASELASVLAQ